MSIKQKFIFIILSVLILGALIVTSCTGGIARGWAGGVAFDGTLFVASMKGKLIAIDATGEQLQSIGESVQLTTTVSSGGLSCLPSCSSQATGLVIYASPVVADAVVSDTADPDYGLVYQVVYVGGVDGKIYAYTFKKDEKDETGKPVPWSTVPEYIYPRQGSMSGEIIGDMILDNNTIYFATSDGFVYALNAKDLSPKWPNPYKIDSKIWSAPVVDGDTLYIGCFNKTIYALNTADGAQKWTYKTDGAINSTPVIYNNTVYIGDYDRHFYALDAATGNLVWKFPSNDTGTSNPQNFFWAKPVVLNGVIYAPCLDGNLYALDASSGNLVKKYMLGDSIVSSPVVIGNSIVVATSVASTNVKQQRGKVYIINTANTAQKAITISGVDIPSFPQNTRDNSGKLVVQYLNDEDIDAPLFAQGNVVYFHTNRDNLYSIDTAATESNLKLLFNLSSVK